MTLRIMLTASKVLAFVIVLAGIYLSVHHNEPDLFIQSVMWGSLLMGVKTGAQAAIQWKKERK